MCTGGALWTAKWLRYPATDMRTCAESRSAAKWWSGSFASTSRQDGTCRTGGTVPREMAQSVKSLNDEKPKP